MRRLQRTVVRFSRMHILRARCSLCNGFKRGKGKELPFAEWIATIETSSCQYCQSMFKGLSHIYPEFSSNQQPGNTLKAEIHYNSVVRITLSCYGQYCEAWSLSFFGLKLRDVPESQDDLIEPPIRAEIALVPGDPAMWKFLRTALETCLREHPECMQHQDSGWFPERLLLIGRDRECHPVARLVQTKNQSPDSGYIALSHCWGPESFIRTTSQNIESHEVEINYSELPHTFKDAITVALETNVKYLWIDSLCIVQDEEDDWAQHAEMMDKIYENALLVAAAVSSSASSVPFLGPDAPTKRSYYCAVEVELPAKGHQKPYDHMPAARVRRDDLNMEPNWIDGPLENRAWAYQERYCATRIISFTDVEAKWQCRVASGCECWGKPMKGGLGDLGKDKTEILKSWHLIITVDYSRRDLTYSSDILPALAGIAARVYARLGSTYIAGLWADELPFDLGWYRSTRLRTGAFVDSGVPTWSWASSNGTVNWLWTTYLGPLQMTGRTQAAPHLNSRVDIKRISCIPRSKNAFGAVEAGSFIELRGRVIPAIMACDMRGRARVSREGFNAQFVLLDGRTISVTLSTNGKVSRSMIRDTGSETSQPAKQSRTSEAEENGDVRDRGSVVCLLLYTATWNGRTQACVLILGQVPGPDKNCYQRLGLGGGELENWAGLDVHQARDGEAWEDIEKWERWEEWFADAEVKTLKIV
jgi:hypothetical protein